MNVTITRAAGLYVDVPIAVLFGFRVDENPADPQRPKDPTRWRLTALMWCDDLPADQPFGHLCIHGGPPPHKIRVIVRPPGVPKLCGPTSVPRLKRIAHDADRLAKALRAGMVTMDDVAALRRRTDVLKAA